MVKDWITLYNGGKAKGPPKITKKMVYIKSTFFSFRNGVLKIGIEPNKRHLEVDLNKYSWIPKDFDKIGRPLMTEKELIITVKKSVGGYAVRSQDHPHALSILRRKGLLTELEYEGLARLIRLWNLLVHGYWTIDDERVYASVKSNLKSVKNFLERLREYVKWAL
ncbi:MAG: HepT-like ribonuclease domain-containing protein [Candidatus Nezhaarchaeales archaeon]